MNDKNDCWWNDSIVVSARSDVGMRRSNNQDSYCLAPAATPRLWKTRGHVFVVADGMGAHAAGELASDLATTIIPQAYLKRLNEVPSDALRNSILQAHEEIRRRGAAEPAFHDMGTTCDALALLPEGAIVGHVGDSRVYRVRNRSIEQLTFDHSLIWEVKYSPNAHPAYKQLTHIPKNVITRSLGPTDSLEVAMEGPFPLAPGDIFLLCSDGLSGQFADSEIGQILESLQPEEATETLINLANLRGGPDNITVVVARYKANPNLDEQEKELKKESKFYQKKAPLSVFAWATLGLAFASFLPTIAAVCLSYVHPSKTLIGVSISLTVLFALFFLWAGRRRFFAKSIDLSDVKLGRGPYVRASSTPQSSFCEDVANTCDRLCEVVRTQNLFPVDWRGVSNARAQANAAFNAFDFAGSLRANASVVNYIMRELKKKNTKKQG